MTDHAPLLAFVDALRAKGVKTYRGVFGDGPIELELGPAVVADVAPAKTEDADLCRCGHKTWEHGGDGLCLLCEVPDKCAEKK